MIGEARIDINGEELVFRFDFEFNRKKDQYNGMDALSLGQMSEEERERFVNEFSKKVDVYSFFENLPTVLRAGLYSGMKKEFSEDYVANLILKHSEALKPVMVAAKEGLGFITKLQELGMTMLQ